MKTKLEFYSSIEELPLERFNAFNKYVMLDSELGSNVQDFDKTILRINEFMLKDMKDEASRELQNVRFVINNVLTMNNVKGLAFASMIKTINGKELTDYSETNLKRVLKDLSDDGLTVGEVIKETSEVKKK
jgi:hypothetical protein